MSKSGFFYSRNYKIILCLPAAIAISWYCFQRVCLSVCYVTANGRKTNPRLFDRGPTPLYHCFISPPRCEKRVITLTSVIVTKQIYRCCHVANDLTNFTGDRRTNQQTNRRTEEHRHRDYVTHGLCIVSSVGPLLEYSVKDIRGTETVALSDNDVTRARRTLRLHGVQLLLNPGTSCLENRIRHFTFTELVIGADRVR